MNICRDCKHGGGCYPVKNPQKYAAGQYGFVRGEEAMMKEIKARGPITCRQAVTKEFLSYKGKGIFKDTTGDKMPRHATSMLGWGTAKDGTKYWVARNSWGTYWGENGFFKIARGVNNLGIEEECSWAVPTTAWKSDMLDRTDKLVTTQDLQNTKDIDENTQHTQSNLRDSKDASSRDIGEAQEANTPSPIRSDKEGNGKAPPSVGGQTEDLESHLLTDDEVQDDTFESDDAKQDEGENLGNADEDPLFKKDQQNDGVEEELSLVN